MNVAKAVRGIHENAEKDGFVCLAKSGFDDEAAKLDFFACVFFSVQQSRSPYTVF